MQSLTVLGATGSIGQSTLDVVARHPDRYRVFALSGRQRLDSLAQACVQFHPQFAVVSDANSADSLQRTLAAQACKTQVLFGAQALCEVAAHEQTDTVMAAIVGAAGLESALAAASCGKRVLLANKEALVMAGPVFLAQARQAQATILPIDSEHNAIFQCLPPAAQQDSRELKSGGVTRILLTASGGPFRQASLEQMRQVTPEQACAHPNWQMGRKISVDSATMMNKGLELIEAQLLFGLPPEKIEVVVHPQSVIHSLVEYEDGSMLAQLGNPDMRTPIAHALAYPERIGSGVGPLDLATIGRLDFEQPDMQRFPCLQLAREAAGSAGAAPCVLNAANEVAVDAFLNRRLGFTDIARVNRAVMDRLGAAAAPANLPEVLALDDQARQLATDFLSRWTK